MLKISAKRYRPCLLAKECYAMKLDLLTNATVVDDAIRFVAEKSNDIDIKRNEENENRDRAITNQVF
jgi:hypothetical protein